METYVKQSKPTARTLSSRSGQAQNEMAKVLQAYRNNTLQLAELTEEDSTLVQGKFTTQLYEQEELMQQKSVNHTGLPDQLKSGVENLSGYNLDAVKVYYNSPKPTQLQAYAYTQGTNIHVAPGQERYLPHEAWHVVQQMKGQVKPTAQLRGIAINDNTRLEREADRMGEKAVSLGKENPITQCYLKSFSPMNSANYPIQGGWWNIALATMFAVGGAVTAALLPETIPILAAVAGGFDVLHGAYSAVNAFRSDRYTIPAGTDLDITNAQGTVEGRTLVPAGPNITSGGKMKVNLEINNGAIGPNGNFVAEGAGDKTARVIEAGFPMLGGLTAAFSPFMGKMGAPERVADEVTGGSSGAYMGGHFTES